MKWEHNPYAKACRDTSDLLGIAPGHYHLWASHTATTLCALVQTDLRSQFYKTPPAKKSKPSLQPGFSLGKDRVTDNQARSTSRLQVLEARKKEVITEVCSPGTTPLPTPSQNQVRRKAEDEIYQKENTQDPVDEWIAVPLRDSSLYYKNGNPRPASKGRLLLRVLTSGKVKRSGGRRKGRKRDRSRGIPVEGPGEPNPEIVEGKNKEDDPIQTPNVDRDKMILFSFIKHVILGEMNKETQNGPTQHTGEAGLEPHTVLAEKHGSNGQGTFFYLAKDTCVMLFEIPQDDDPVVNKTIQENRLSAGLGVTLTKHITSENTAEFAKTCGASGI